VPSLQIAARDKRLLASAQRICRRMRIKDPAVEASCVVDVLVTGDFRFATAAARVDRTVRAKPKAKPQPKPKPPKPKPTTAQATLVYQGTTYTYLARKGSIDGCELDNVGGIAFRLIIGTLTPADKVPYFDLDAGFLAKKDGTYRNQMLTFETDGTLHQALDLTVTLAGKRTRGTFSGTAQGNRVSGSFRC